MKFILHKKDFQLAWNTWQRPPGTALDLRSKLTIIVKSLWLEAENKIYEYDNWHSINVLYNCTVCTTTGSLLYCQKRPNVQNGAFYTEPASLPTCFSVTSVGKNVHFSCFQIYESKNITVFGWKLYINDTIFPTLITLERCISVHQNISHIIYIQWRFLFIVSCKSQSIYIMGAKKVVP